jgi:uncharacterized OB-fold protein
MMKKSYLNGLLLTIIFGPFGLLYIAKNIFILFIVVAIGYGVYHEEIIRWLSVNEIDDPLRHWIQPIFNMIVNNVIDDKGTALYFTFGVVIWIVFTVLSILSLPFAISSYNRHKEEERYKKIMDRIFEVENKLKPKIPKKLQAYCMSCSNVISVRDDICPHCASSTPFGGEEEKNKLMTYIENNLKNIFLNEDEFRDFSDYYQPYICLSNSRMRRIYGKILLRYFRKSKPFFRKIIFYAIISVLSISGLSMLISVIFDVNIWILWIIISTLLFLALLVGAGYYGVSSNGLYKKIFEPKKRFLHNSVHDMQWPNATGIYAMMHIARYVNVFREKYSDDDKLKILIERYIATYHKTKDFIENHKDAIKIHFYLVIVVQIVFGYALFASFYEGYYILSAVLAWVMLLTFVTLKGLYYIITKYGILGERGYLGDIEQVYRDDSFYIGFFPNGNLKEYLDYNTPL